MIDTLLEQAAADPSSRGTNFLVGPSQRLTNAQAAERVRAVAAEIRARGLKKLAVHVADSPELAMLLCACAAAECEVCVLNRQSPPGEIAEQMQRFDLPVVAADSPLQVGGVTVLSIKSLFAAKESREARAPNSDARLIVLTTGTTGPPKGAQYRWTDMVAQARRDPRLAGTRWFMAYHMNHFAGLTGLVHILINRATMVFAASAEMTDAIAAIESNRVEYVSGTPTFWRFLLTQLPCERARSIGIKQITLGGEAVGQDLLDKLRDWFPAARISQIFATTETGSLFSVRDTASGLPAMLLDTQVKIIDGELHVRAAHGMLGYYGETKGAGATAESEWRSTGDLVEVRGDRIHFVGRKSETINVGGAKVHPLPIEQLVQLVEGVAAVHCYGRRNPVTGQLVAVDVVAQAGADTAALEAAIREACESLPPHAQPRIIRFVPEFELANRKVVRRANNE